MLDKNILKQYEEIEEKITIESDKLLSEINEIEPISGFKHLSFSKFDYGDIEYFGEESWQYGGYQSYEYSLPMQLLYDKEYKEKYIQDLKDKVAERNRKEEERRKEKEKQDFEKAKAQYEKLKNKFEGEVQ